MDRRTFAKGAIAGAWAAGRPAGAGAAETAATHTLTLSFDDGFKTSFRKIAEIHERFGLRACFNVIAAGHLPEFKGVDRWIQPALLGNFDDWNALKERGHEVMPHSWDHKNLAQMPLAEAEDSIAKCLDYFKAHLRGYRDDEAVFNFPFNASNPAVERFTLTRTRGLRTQGDEPFNAPPRRGPARLVCWSHGPENADAWVEGQVRRFLARPGGWMILNLHGLDDEGWGPIRASYLAELLGRLSAIKTLELRPAGEVLARAVDVPAASPAPPGAPGGVRRSGP